MVYDNIHFVRGTIINDSELRRLAQSNKSTAETIISNYNEEIKGGHKEFSSEWWQAFYDHFTYTEVLSSLNDQLDHGVSIHHWKCCSELSELQYIVGVIYHEVSIDEIFNKTSIVPDLPSSVVDRNIQKTLAELEIENTRLISVIMLDDCIHCT